MAGVRVPVIPMSHQYLVTQPFRERGEGRLPTLRDPDLLIYYREDGDGLVMGGYERHSEPAFMPDGAAGLDRIPPDFNGRLLEEDWDRFEEIIENSKRRVPAMDEITVTKLINGPEAFTPDNEFCLGETEVGGFFVCAGFCAHGLAGAGGIGKVIAEWIAEGEPSLDLWQMDIRRFGAQYRSPAYTHARIKETYETYYDIRYPNHERQAGRPLRVSPVNAWHREHERRLRREVGLGAGQLVRARTPRRGTRRCGRAAGRASTGRRRSAPSTAPPARRSRSSTRPPSPSSRSRGPGAAEFLEGLCDNRVAREVGADHLHADAQPPRRDRVRLHRRPPRRGALLDRHRHRLRQPRPRVDAPPPPRRRQRADRRRHLARACFGIWGPRARDVLAPLTPADLGNEAFPYMSCARRRSATCRCGRCG